jgi:aminomethyltransferase
MTQAPRPTPLRSLHVKSGARLVDFAGWELPVQFSGIQLEHNLVRTGVGLFDVSHMGRISISGTGALPFLDSLLPYDVQRLTPGRMAYTVLCNDAGGVIDDLAVYLLTPEEYLLVINASRSQVDLDWIRRHAAKTQAQDVEITDHTATQAMIAIQGPGAEMLVTATIYQDAQRLGFFRCQTLDRPAGDWLLSRSGYTGEDGFELICPADAATDVWQTLVDAGAQPAGLAARDTLRLEAGLCLYGNELSEKTNPLEAGLSWTLALDKGSEFPGKSALRRQLQSGVTRRLIGLRLLERGIPRGHQDVQDGDIVIGQITSGSHSPVLQQGIAMAYVDVAFTTPGQVVTVTGRGRSLQSEVVKLPFVPPRVKRRKKRRKNQGNEAN